MNYELKIHILAREYIDILVIALARQGYAPYITDEDDVCITIEDDELTKLTDK